METWMVFILCLMPVVIGAIALYCWWKRCEKLDAFSLAPSPDFKDIRLGSDWSEFDDAPVANVVKLRPPPPPTTPAVARQAPRRIVQKPISFIEARREAGKVGEDWLMIGSSRPKQNDDSFGDDQ